LEKVVPDCGPSIFAAGMVHTAISRVRKLEDLILLDFDPGAFKQRKNGQGNPKTSKYEAFYPFACD